MSASALPSRDSLLDLARASPRRYGSDARNRLADTSNPTIEGARAALETFYFALNNRDPDALAAVWSQHPLAQLNNPLGGMLRGGDAITALYRRIFTGPVRLTVELGDIVEYLGEDHALFAGRETGAYRVKDGKPVAVTFRTSRYFRYDDGRWRQFHHHGSMDEPQALDAYQRAIP
jgi:ketosteroid isomerase-like protein